MSVDLKKGPGEQINRILCFENTATNCCRLQTQKYRGFFSFYWWCDPVSPLLVMYGGIFLLRDASFGLHFSSVLRAGVMLWIFVQYSTGWSPCCGVQAGGYGAIPRSSAWLSWTDRGKWPFPTARKHSTPRCRFRILGCLLPHSSDLVRQESTFSSSLLCLFYLPCVCLLSQHCSGCLEKYWGSFRLRGRMVSSQNCPSCPVIWRGERVLCWFYFPSSPWLWGPGLNCGKYAVVWPSYSWYLLYCLCLICGVHII